MYSKTLIDAYMKAKNYIQYKQVAADLGFTTAYIAEINQGHKEFTEETALYIAKEVGLDEQEVILRIAREKAKSETTKAAWDKLLKKYQNSLQAASVLGFMLFSQCFSYFA
ncbi:DUF3693 domain-containing protein [Zobellella sp. An-6]|uniref:DUF3693 domain-containing protein n=1 Tax=Zobellella sp. An-6 TaxID=3400218 RepID=UPI004041756D